MDREQLFDDLNSLFDSFLESKGIDLDNTKLTTNRYNSIMMYLYNAYINKLEITLSTGIKQYSYIDFINIVEWYIAKSLYLDIISLYGLCLLINRSIGFLNNLKFADDIELQSSFIFDINSSVVNNNIIKSNSVNDIKCSSMYDTNIYMADDRAETQETQGNAKNATALLKTTIQKIYETIQNQTVNKLNDTTIGLIANANNNKDIGLMYAKERIEMQVKARQTIALSDLPLLE